MTRDEYNIKMQQATIRFARSAAYHVTSGAFIGIYLSILSGLIRLFTGLDMFQSFVSASLLLILVNVWGKYDKS